MKTDQIGASLRSWLLVSLAIVFVIVSATSQAAAQSETKKPDKNEILRKAGQSYYVLQSQGLKAYRCTVQPNWKLLWETLQKGQTAPDDAKLALLSPVRYSVVVDEGENTTVSPLLTTGETLEPGLQQVVDGVRQMIQGFFQSWNSMVFANFFSPLDVEKLADSEQPDGYHFTGSDGGANIELVLTKDSLLTAIKSSSPSSVVVMHPTFAKTDKGLLMSSLEADINNGTQKVTFQIAYQQVEGFQLPGKTSYQVTLPTASFSVEMSFTEYQITKR